MILFTTFIKREDLGFVADYLEQHGIPFDHINENPPFNRSASKKIYANAYLDDRAGLSQVYKELQYLIQKI
jgi:tRNA1(Val) A37 N6-methylase TrmN6